MARCRNHPKRGGMRRENPRRLAAGFGRVLTNAEVVRDSTTVESLLPGRLIRSDRVTARLRRGLAHASAHPHESLQLFCPVLDDDDLIAWRQIDGLHHHETPVWCEVILAVPDRTGICPTEELPGFPKTERGSRDERHRHDRNCRTSLSPVEQLLAVPCPQRGSAAFSRHRPFAVLNVRKWTHVDL